MKTLILILLMPFCSYGQTHNQLAVNLQSGYSTHNSVNGSIMLGVQASNQTQGFIGVTYKRFISLVGHSKEYVGLRAHVQSTFDNTGITPYLEVYVLQGEYFTYGLFGENTAYPEKDIQIGGVFGVGYIFSENIGLFAGYSINEYNPEKYVVSGNSPYNKGAVSVKISYSIPLSSGFNSGNIQRRMY